MANTHVDVGVSEDCQDATLIVIPHYDRRVDAAEPERGRALDVCAISNSGIEGGRWSESAITHEAVHFWNPLCQDSALQALRAYGQIESAEVDLRDGEAHVRNPLDVLIAELTGASFG